MKDERIQFSIDAASNPPHSGVKLRTIPQYVLRLAEKRRGVRCHYDQNGLAKRQSNYFMHEGQ